MIAEDTDISTMPAISQMWPDLYLLLLCVMHLKSGVPAFAVEGTCSKPFCVDLKSHCSDLTCYVHLQGQMYSAFSILGKIMKMGLQPNTITLTALLKGLCFNNKVEKALHFCDELMAKGFRLDEHGALAGSYSVA
ncbi:hypothetical protein K1719_030293 [Acacia pycnantha]|nr:hypothetical protein K1719_030293 [Acacia pycnantha]